MVPAEPIDLLIAPAVAGASAGFSLLVGPHRRPARPRALDLLGVGVAAAVLAWPHEGAGAVLVIAGLQVLAELFVGRNHAVALLFVTPLALMMGQLVALSPVQPLLRDRLLETVLGAFIAMAVLLVVPDRPPRRGRTSR